MRVATVACICVLGLTANAHAQILLGPADAPRRGSWEIGGGAAWVSGFDLGDSAAQLTRNADASAGPFDLFSTSSELEASPGVQGRVGFYLSRRIALEAGIRFSQPTLSTRVSADSESADDLTASEQLSQYVFDGSLVYHLTNLAFANGRAVPFVSGGGGYVRELHQGDELIETGTEVHGSGGLKLWFGSGRRRYGVRAEAGASSRDGGFDFREGRRTVPFAAVSLSVLF